MNSSYTHRGMTRVRLSAVTLLTAVVLGGGVAGCTSTSSASDRGPVSAAGVNRPSRVGVAEFVTVISKPGVQIIDVRTPAEFADGHIAGAVNIPVQQPDFSDRVAQLDPNATYAVYCRSGNRSQPAVARMQSAGITTIYELDSGLNGWAAEGHPLDH